MRHSFVKSVLLTSILLTACGESQPIVNPVSPVAIEWKSTPGVFFGSGMAQGYRENHGLYVFGGIQYPGGEASKLYSLLGTQMTELTDTGYKRGYVKGFVRGDDFYIVSGRNNFLAEKSLLKINLDTYGVTELGAMNTGRLSEALGVFNDGRIIVGGGYTPSESAGYLNYSTTNDSLEQYDPSTNVWTTLDVKMPEGRVTHTSGFVYENHFYVFGGYTPGNDNGGGTNGNPLQRDFKKGIWRLDGSTWSKVGEMPIGLAGMDVAIWKHYAIIVGGHYPVDPYVKDGVTFVYNYSDKQFVLDLNNGQVSELSTLLPIASNDVSLTIHGDDLYAIGGEDYDPANSNKANITRIGKLTEVN